MAPQIWKQKMSDSILCFASRVTVSRTAFAFGPKRTRSLVLTSVLAAAVLLSTFGERSKPEPSEPEMKLSFSRFLTRLEANSPSEIKFTAFEKLSCKWSNALSGHICSFKYSTELPSEKLSVLAGRGTLTGTFSVGEDGDLKFETVIG